MAYSFVGLERGLNRGNTVVTFSLIGPSQAFSMYTLSGLNLAQWSITSVHLYKFEQIG